MLRCDTGDVHFPNGYISDAGIFFLKECTVLLLSSGKFFLKCFWALEFPFSAACLPIAAGADSSFLSCFFALFCPPSSNLCTYSLALLIVP